MMKPTATTEAFQPLGRKTTDEYGRARSATSLPFLPGQSATRLRIEFALKACLDRTLAALLLVLTAPVVFLSVALVKLTSRGPAFYSQERVGQFGRVFTIWKIRTMFNNCEKLTGPRWSTPGDPRVTTIGKVLRTLHIDELPQLLNVLLGQMSLIGPRPERPEIAGKLKGLVEGYDVRHAVLPGISGNAQIHLPPDTNVGSVREKLVLDRAYIGAFSAWLDIKLLVLTGFKMLRIYSSH